MIEDHLTIETLFQNVVASLTLNGVRKPSMMASCKHNLHANSVVNSIHQWRNVCMLQLDVKFNPIIMRDAWLKCSRALI